MNPFTGAHVPASRVPHDHGMGYDVPCSVEVGVECRAGRLRPWRTLAVRRNFVGEELPLQELPASYSSSGPRPCRLYGGLTV